MKKILQATRTVYGNATSPIALEFKTQARLERYMTKKGFGKFVGVRTYTNDEISEELQVIGWDVIG